MSKKTFQYLCLLVVVCVFAVFTARLINQLFFSELTRYKSPHTHGSVLYPDNDNMAWILTTEEAIKQKRWVIHHVSWDGGIHGREHHWSSPLVWVLKLGALSVMHFTGEAPIHAIETAVPFIYSGIALLSLLSILMAALLAFGRYGLWFFSMFAGTVFPIWEPIKFDHHGIILTAITLSILLIQWGLSTPTKQITAFGISGIFLGFAYWFSAINSIPSTIAITVGVIVYCIYCYKYKIPNPLKSTAIRWFALSLSGTTLVAYVIEYANNWVLRMEVNNPVYSIILLCGFLALADIFQRKWIRGSILLVIPIGLSGWLLAQEGFRYGSTMQRMMVFISECTPIASIQQHGFWVIVVALVAFTAPKYHYHKILIALTFTCFAILFTGFAFRNIWSLYLGVIWLTCTVIPLYHDSRVRAAFITIPLILVWYNIVITQFTYSRTGDLRILDPANTGRVEAEAIHKQGIENALIVADPSTSTALAYYTGGTSLGSIYWESESQIAIGAKILSTEKQEEFEDLLKETQANVVRVQKDNSYAQYIAAGRKAIIPNDKSIASQLANGKITLGKEVPIETKDTKILIIEP